MPDVVAMSLAAAIAAAVDVVAFNGLTVRRTRAYAAWADPGAPSGLGRTAALGLGAQLLALVPRRAWSYAVQLAAAAWLAQLPGLGELAGEALAGMVAGGSEGLVLAPTRRLMALGQARPALVPGLAAGVRLIVATEGLGGLWRGAGTNALRTAVGGGAWFAGVALGARWLPGLGPVAHGLLGSLVTTLVVHPFERRLSEAYRPAGLAGAARPGALRGLGPAMLRALPSSALSYGLTMALFARLVRG